MKNWLPLFLLLAACGKEQISVPRFRETALPLQTDPSAVWFTDTLHGSISGGKAWESGFVLSTQDGGDTWVVDTLLDRRMEHVTFDPEGQGYVCGQDIMLYRPPGSAAWAVQRIDFQWLRCAHFPSRHYGAVVSGEGYHLGQLRVFGPELFWQSDTLHQFQGEMETVWFADSLTILAAGAGWVVRSENGGKSWERLHLTDDFYSSIHFPDARTGYMCGYSGSILKSTDGGKTWQKLRKPGQTGKRKKTFNALWFTDAENGWIVGDNGVFWRTDDGGQSWKEVAEAPKDADYTDVFVRDAQGWATAKGGRFFRF